MVHEGPAFTENHNVDFDYSDRSELTQAYRREGTTPGQGDNTNSPYDWDFDYDNIGNRNDSALDSTSTYYCVNDLNQYTYTAEAEECPDPDPPIDTFDYDDDGNLIEDGTFDYTWDAENRLIAVAPVSPGEGDKKLVFKYDYMGRRVRKMVYDWDTQGSDWEADPSSDLYFMYENNGWNVIMVLDGMDGDDEGTDPDFTTLTKYTWGLDMSGGLHGAGNIGALLGAYETQGTSSTADDKKYWFVYDGNGNVAQIFDFTDDIYHPTVAARYEYDPYGQIIGPDTDNDGDWRDNATAYALANPFRFSTKWLDEDLRANDQTGAIGETGLYYYGYRYYSPTLGRWINRDPFEEQGDLNLYLFVQNEPQNKIDSLGLQASGQFTTSFPSWPMLFENLQADFRVIAVHSWSGAPSRATHYYQGVVISFTITTCKPGPPIKGTAGIMDVIPLGEKYFDPPDSSGSTSVEDVYAFDPAIVPAPPLTHRNTESVSYTSKHFLGFRKLTDPNVLWNNWSVPPSWVTDWSQDRIGPTKDFTLSYRFENDWWQGFVDETINASSDGGLFFYSRSRMSTK